MAFSGGSTTAPLTAGRAEEADVDVVFGFGDPAGVAGVVAVAEADAGTGVEDATGTGEEDAGAPTLTGCAVGLSTGAWAKAVAVKKLRALRIKNTFFISNVRQVLESTLLSRVKNDSSVPRVENENVTAATHSPSLHTLRRSDVFRDGHARVVYTFGVRFYREV